MEHPRLRQAEIAALTLQRFWLDEFNYAGLPRTGDPVEQGSGVEVKASHPTFRQNPDDALQYFVRLRVKASRDGQILDATISGLFAVKEVPGDGTISPLIQFNAPSVLYGILRGMVAGLTGATDDGRLDLPLINILQLAR